MDHLLDYLPNRSLRLEDVKMFFRHLLLGLDFLHTKTRIIHTGKSFDLAPEQHSPNKHAILQDLQLKNLLLPVGNPFFYTEFEEGECNDPSSHKILQDRTIYCSRYMSQNFQGLPLICDFGEAMFGDREYNHDIMPHVYRVPEVVMQMSWNYEVDIWSVAMTTWDLVAPDTLFHRQNPETNEPDDRYLIAMLGAVLGPPPVEYMRRSKVCPIFWDEDGTWRDVVPMPGVTLGGLASNIEGEDKSGFLRFIRRILRWIPEERPTASELILDPWLQDELGSSEQDARD